MKPIVEESESNSKESNSLSENTSEISDTSSVSSSLGNILSQKLSFNKRIYSLKYTVMSKRFIEMRTEVLNDLSSATMRTEVTHLNQVTVIQEPNSDVQKLLHESSTFRKLVKKFKTYTREGKCSHVISIEKLVKFKRILNKTFARKYGLSKVYSQSQLL